MLRRQKHRKLNKLPAYMELIGSYRKLSQDRQFTKLGRFFNALRLNCFNFFRLKNYASVFLISRYFIADPCCMLSLNSHNKSKFDDLERIKCTFRVMPSGGQSTLVNWKVGREISYEDNERVQVQFEHRLISVLLLSHIYL